MPYGVLHILSNLGTYGAQRIVGDLLPQLNGDPFDVRAMTVYNSIVDPGVPVIQIERRGRADVGFFARMVSHIRAMRPAIVHTHTHNGKYWGRAAAIVAGVPIIVHTEHCPTDVNRRWTERIGDRVLNKATRATIVFAPSHVESLRGVEEIREERLVVIPNGIAELQPADHAGRAAARLKIGAPSDAFVIFMVGRLSRAKHVDVGIRALAALPAPVRSKIALRILGDGPERGEFETLSRTLGLNGEVAFLGFRDDARALLSAADLLLIASDHEGMPMTILEAMMCGVPVLSSPWEGADALLGEGRGWLTASWDPSEYAKFVARFADGSINVTEAVSRARRFALESHAIAETACKYRNLYLSLLEGDCRCA